MAQGKPFTREERQEIVKSLQPYLEAGLSRNKACEAIGLKPQTLSVWVQEDESLLIKLRGWENTLNVLAMSNVASGLQAESESEDPRKETSKWWLERRMRNEFSTRVEQTGKDGGPVQYEDLSQLSDEQLAELTKESESGTG